MDIAQLICGVNRKIEQAMESHLKPNGLAIEQYRVLEALDENDGLSMGDLAARVFVDAPTLTKIIDRMVSNADVYRAPDPRDRRRVLIFRSPKGAETFARLNRLVSGMRNEIIEDFGTHQADELRNLLGQLLVRLDPGGRAS